MNVKNRKGAAAVVALVLIAVLAGLSTVLIKGLLREQLQNRRNVMREQVQRLTYDFLQRSEEILRNDAAFTGETIEIPRQADPRGGTYQLTSKIDPNDATVLVSTVYRDAEGKILYTYEQTAPKPQVK